MPLTPNVSLLIHLIYRDPMCTETTYLYSVIISVWIFRYIQILSTWHNFSIFLIKSTLCPVSSAVLGLFNAYSGSQYLFIYHTAPRGLNRVIVQTLCLINVYTDPQKYRH